MKPVDMDLAAYLDTLDAQLNDLLPARRLEIIGETRGHLEAMIEARRTDGLDENEAWQSAKKAFGDAEAVGKELAREWKRAPRFETVGTPLSRREKIKMFARSILLSVTFFAFGASVADGLRNETIAGYWGNALIALFTLGCWGYVTQRWRRRGGKWTPTHLLFHTFVTLQLVWANSYLAFGARWHGTVWEKMTIYQSFVMVVIMGIAGGWLMRRPKHNAPLLPWRQMPLYAQNPIAAEETYRLWPKVGAVGRVISGCLLWSWMGWNFFGFWPAALLCAGEITAAYFGWRWQNNRIR